MSRQGQKYVEMVKDVLKENKEAYLRDVFKQFDSNDFTAVSSPFNVAISGEQFGTLLKMIRFSSVSSSIILDRLSKMKTGVENESTSKNVHTLHNFCNNAFKSVVKNVKANTKLIKEIQVQMSKTSQIISDLNSKFDTILKEAKKNGMGS